MEIYFSSGNYLDIFKLPYVPPEVEFERPLNYETFDNVNGETLTLIGKPGLRTITIESFFPNRIYSFLGNVTPAYFCIDFFEKNLKKKVRIVVASSSINCNMECIVVDFRYKKRHNGDVLYSLTLQEYVPPKKLLGGLI